MQIARHTYASALEASNIFENIWGSTLLDPRLIILSVSKFLLSATPAYIVNNINVTTVSVCATAPAMFREIMAKALGSATSVAQFPDTRAGAADSYLVLVDQSGMR